ncbi:MAG: L,D-transpeptidase [bacterium]
MSELKKSAAKGEFDAHRWKWVLVRQAKKGERVELYENGRKIFSSPANTGEFATTPDGTWYVFLRFHDTKMSGLSPKRISKKVYASLKLKHYKMVGCLDGHPVKMVHYADSGIKYVSYFNNNIALHYMLRPRYGFPQSAGCIELPEHDAKFLYKNIGYGTMVTVIGSTARRPIKKQDKENASSGKECKE